MMLACTLRTAMCEDAAMSTQNAPANVTAAAAGHRIMLDSVSWQAVLAAVRAGQKFRGLPVSLAAGYLDGHVSQWPEQAWKELQLAGITGRALVGITVTGQGGEAARARVGDSEPGDMSPAGAAAWALAQRNAGHWPVVYCDRSDKPHVIAECFQRGLHLATDFGLWVATLDGTFTDLDGSDLRTQRGVVAIQVEQAFSPVHVAGQPPDLDVSLVVSAAWRAAAKPPPAGPTKAELVAAAELLTFHAKALLNLIKARQ